MNIQENIPIAPYTTFKIGGPARFFCIVGSEDDLLEAVEFAKTKNLSLLVVGGGSNLLISDSGFDGLVILNRIMGKKYSRPLGGEFLHDSSYGFEAVPAGRQGENYSLKKDARNISEFESDSVLVEVGAGEDWEKLVAEVVAKGLYGMENLSSIPGTIGASPVQNVGAYGADASGVIESVRALDTETMKFVELTNADCRFSYRDSRFKHEKNRYVISLVTFRLQVNGRVNISYKDLRRYFADRKIENPSLGQVREAVIEIRKAKLPDWTKWGTAGSFFKNPVVSAEKFEQLRKSYPELPGYKEPDGRVKVSLAWILDNVCNAKGLVVGNVGTYEKQALVIVAKPGATAKEVIALAQKLMRAVREKTGIAIEAEVEWAVV